MSLASTAVVSYVRPQNSPARSRRARSSDQDGHATLGRGVVQQCHVTEKSDEALMRAYVGGDEAAFQALFERYGPIIYGLTKRHLRDDELAREITQQTFFRLHGARNDFRLDSRLRPWLLTIAMNLVREHWRRQKRRRRVDIDVDDKAAPVPERTAMELDERAKLVRQALAQLPASQREVIELHWFQERPYKEVAEILGTSEGAVRVRAHRAYNRLKVLLEDDVR